MRRLAAWLSLFAPLALAACLLAPGKFTSTLDIDKDRHFVFTYVGDVTAIDVARAMNSLGDTPDDTAGGDDDDAGANGHDADEAASVRRIALQKGGDDTSAKAEAKNRAIAAALAKEAGFRRVDYLGNNRFAIDYRIAGTLDRGFVWPYNLDAEAVLPFVAIEVRGNGTVRVKAPGFANESKAPGGDEAADLLDGTFTLTTDAEIVSQNNEDGATAGANGRKVVTWRAIPTTRTAPMAVLRMAR